ncbi:S8 family serine peptidase [Flavobacterium daejeonense]|uniref:S8 family serine peptidase n=1 Tax=Flavobacterium daejeonense TaxID=350893 RepID=UPI0006921A50|nr:S8 family serine peptidase [Flavobacterium daejeonense]
MKKTYLVIIYLFIISGIFAQDKHYYYYKGQKVYLTLDKAFLNITADENTQKSSFATLNVKDFNFEIDSSNSKRQKIAKLEFKNIPSDFEFLQKINSLKENQNIKNVSFYYKRNNSSSIGTSNYFYIKLNNIDDFITLQKIADQKDVQIVKQVPNMPLWYILSLKTTTEGTSLDLVNYFYETGLFADVDPAFMFNFKKSCTNDTNFGNLWGLYNSANPSIDINACQAWNISQGSNVKIAVVDQGIDKSHNDLSGNISNLSYNAQTFTSPSLFINGNIHGTHVAGTIGAIKDNNLQVVGVAPLSKIMSISHSLSLTPNISAELASGISWAYQNGADVINNSWGDQGGQYNQLHSSILESAITNAMTLGRNNKGTLIVFAAGNFGSSSPIMDYPANFNDDIITVGSITSTGTRSSFSGYGTKLDVIAPGSSILSTVPNNGIQSLDGTSMAAPHVAGICALILSVNPSLTSQEVRDIIEQTSQKVSGNIYSYSTVLGRVNGTWNNQMGYGLVDAYEAVKMAQCSIKISGNESICNSQTYTAPSGSNNWNWSITEGANLVTLVGGNTSTVTLTPLGGNGYVTLSLYFESSACGYKTLTKRMLVNTSNINIVTYENDDICFENYNYAGYVVYGSSSSVHFSNFSSSIPSQNNLIHYIPNGLTLDGLGRKYLINVPRTLLGEQIFYNITYTNQCGELITEPGNIPIVANECYNSLMFEDIDNTYTIYPNPSSSIINIALLDQNKAPTKKSIITGKLYDFNNTEKLILFIKDNNAQIDVTGLNKGVYFLKIDVDGKIESHKVIVK